MGFRVGAVAQHALAPALGVGEEGLRAAFAISAGQQIDDRAAKEGISVDQATRELLGEKEPSLQFTTPEQLGGLAVFFCSPAADNVRGQAWAHDGGWTAQ